MKGNLKASKGFKISEARVLRFMDESVQQKPSYHGAFSKHSVLKSGCRWVNVKADVMGDVSCVKDAKKKDVMTLLDLLYGENGVPENVKMFYDSAFQSASITGDRDSESGEEDDL